MGCNLENLKKQEAELTEAIKEREMAYQQILRENRGKVEEVVIDSNTKQEKEFRKKHIITNEKLEELKKKRPAEIKQEISELRKGKIETTNTFIISDSGKLPEMKGFLWKIPEY